MTKYLAAAAAAVVLAGLGLTYVLTLRTPDDQFASCRGGVVAGGAADIGGPFTLVSETGETVSEADVLDVPALIYFGYTFCPDVCPIDTVRNADAVDILRKQGLDVRPVFISIDPERDTPEVLAEYTDYIHPDLIGLTGTADQIKDVSTSYRTYYRKQETGDEFYLVDHSTFTYLTLPGQGFVEFFRRDLSPEDLATRTACYLNAA